MTKVISISTDRNIFTEGSAVRARQVEYGGLFEELHIVVFTRFISGLPAKVQIAPNVWVYGTHSISKLFYIRNAYVIASKIISDRGFSRTDSVVTVQDPFETGLVGTKLAHTFNLPLHVQIHTDFLSPYFSGQSILNRIRVKIAKKVLPKADSVRVVSKRIADSLAVFRIELKADVVPSVVPIFVDVDKIESGEVVASDDLKKKYPQFNFIILMASRLSAEKNIPFAIGVFKRLLNVCPKAGLILVGQGPEEKKLQALVKKFGIEQSVVFESWKKDLTPYYKTANLFFTTSLYEGYGMTLVETVAAHCPIVSSDVGIASQLLNTDAGSFVCPVGDEDCFFEKISNLVQDTGLRERLVHAVHDKLDSVVIRDKSQYMERLRLSIESAKRVL